MIEGIPFHGEWTIQWINTDFGGFIMQLIHICSVFGPKTSTNEYCQIKKKKKTLAPLSVFCSFSSTFRVHHMHHHGCQHKLVSKVLQTVTETLAGRSRLLSVMKVEFHCHTNLSH